MAEQTKKFPFTRAALDALIIPEKGKIRYYDSKTPGLCIVVFSTGRKKFYFFKRVNGIQEEMALGEYTGLQDQIRHAVMLSTHSAGAAAHGESPTSVKRELREKAKKEQDQRAKLRREDTMSQFFERYQEEGPKGVRTMEEERKRFNVRIAPFIGKKKVSQVTHDDIVEIYRDVSRRKLNWKGQAIKGEGSPVQANRALSQLQHMFRVAIEMGYRTDNPVTEKTIRKHKEESRERFLKRDELGRFFTALDTIDPNFKDAFLIAILTGARRSNVFGMKWNDIDFYSKTWTIKASEAKGKKTMTLALPQEAIDLLQDRKAKRESLSFVFPGTGQKGHIVEPKGQWKKLLKNAELSDLKLHDLRRTLGSYMAANNDSLHIIGKALGHQSQQATQIYARLQLDPVRKAVQSSVTSMLKIAKTAGESEKVTPLPRAKAPKLATK